MNERANDPDAGREQQEERGNELSPLAGEPGIPDVARPKRQPIAKKGLVAVALLTVSLIGATAVSIQRWAGGAKKADDGEPRSASDRPQAASTEARRLDLTLPAVASAPEPVQTRVPAIVPTPEERAQPIGVRPTAPAASPRAPIRPEDAPVLLLSAGTPVTRTPAQPPRDTEGASEQAPEAVATRPTEALAETRRNLEAYQRQLQTLLDRQTKGTAGESASAVSMRAANPTAPGDAAATPALFGGQLPRSATPRVEASMLANRSLTLPKGTAFTCALTTRVVSAAAGFVGCRVQRNVYGDDGRVLLIERGSQLDGEYRVASVKPGTVRIPVLWVRLRTPNGVTVDIDSPATGALGESGVDGYVDNRWPERIGAALLLSLIDDSVKLALGNQSSGNGNDTVVLQSTTTETGKLAEKVLDSTINIPPLIYQNQGGVVGIYVARDVDFSTVYALKETPR